MRLERVGISFPNRIPLPFVCVHRAPLLKADGRDAVAAATVGCISREAPEGKVLEAWAEKLKNTNFNLSDVANGLSALFAEKSNEELAELDFSYCDMMCNSESSKAKNKQFSQLLVDTVTETKGRGMRFGNEIPTLSSI
ncbi:hypothetical protein RIF29_25949 [Crotalaria pallida]|uniref:FACT complex subunit n=1 Tax=Crotalaria pallida TaxID=3830 RepID=A0AAN9EM57_CROPI